MNVREYYGYSLNAYKSLSLADAVSAPYLCSLPSATYLSAIGQTLLAAAATYPCDCDPLDHHSHVSKGLHMSGCLPSI